jgi:hypothetical protein
MNHIPGRLRRAVPRPVKTGLRRAVAGLPRIDRKTDGISNILLADRRRDLATRRTFGRHDLDRIDALLRRADGVVPIREAFAQRDDWPERFIALRHDMDHDVENSVRLAEWEAERGHRSTYYVLHRDWYWGGPDAAAPSKLVLRGLDRIASLGHEIGLHNNAITIALKTGRDPARVLDDDLAALRRHGFDVTGSVAHGDRVCREVGYVNDEIFVERPRPEFGAPDRTLSYADPESKATHEVTLEPRPMADFGLTHEANSIGHSQYLSDSDGRWNVPFTDLDDRFAAEGGFLQILVHPIWWALSGEAVRSRPTIVAPADVEAARTGDPTAPPFPIVVRGDCCSRRAIDLNRDLFGGNPQMTRDEKARTDFFLDAIDVGSATPDDIVSLMDVERMGTSLRRYAIGQTDRSTLAAADARLLVFDDYSDMNFGAWRSRAHGWKIWIHPAFLRDRDAFDRDFESVGQLDFDESLAAHVRLIEHYRRQLGDVPVLYLHQPTAYYRKLDGRVEFRRLGTELERAVPRLFAADLHDAELEPDDMGSCGPGQTLHFQGTTYRKMIQLAMEKGLAEWLKPESLSRTPR